MDQPSLALSEEVLDRERRSFQRADLLGLVRLVDAVMDRGDRSFQFGLSCFGSCTGVYGARILASGGRMAARARKSPSIYDFCGLDPGDPSESGNHHAGCPSRCPVPTLQACKCTNARSRRLILETCRSVRVRWADPARRIIDRSQCHPGSRPIV